MVTHKDYDESETTNLFADDYVTAELFDEEDEEIGTDFHEVDLGNPKIADVVIRNYNEREPKKQKRKRRNAQYLEDIPDEVATNTKKERVLAQLPQSLAAKGYITLVIETVDKIIILK